MQLFGIATGGGCRRFPISSALILPVSPRNPTGSTVEFSPHDRGDDGPYVWLASGRPTKLTSAWEEIAQRCLTGSPVRHAFQTELCGGSGPL